MATQAAGLRRGTLGLTSVVYQGITHIAPAANVLFSWTFIASFAGAAMPLSLALSVVVCFFIANTVAQFSRYTPSAGGYYTFASRGLGPRFGFITTWAYLFYDWIGPAGAIGYFGVLSETFIKNNSGVDIPWWIYALAAFAVVWILTYLGISISSRTAAVLGTLELLVMTALGVSFLLHSAHGSSFAAPFDPRSSPTGLQGILLGMVFSILALSGFEAAAPLAEEARKPTEFIRKAIMWSLFAVGAFYIFSTYSTAIGFGTSQAQMKVFGSASDSLGAFYTAAKGLWGGFWVLIYFAVLNSILGVGISCTNAASRVMYTMGRAGTLPAIFARIHPRHRTPTFAIHVQQIVGIVSVVVVALVLGASQIFGFLGTAVTVALIVMYGLANIALYVYVRREHPGEFKLWQHAIFPAAGTIMLVIVLYETITSNQAYPLNLAPWVIVVWLAIGAAVMMWLANRNPAALAAGGSKFVLPAEDEPAVGLS